LLERNAESGSKTHTDTYVVKLLADIHNNNFIYPEGLSNAIQLRRQDQLNSKAIHGHPNLSEHQFIAFEIAAKLGIMIDIHTDLQKYDILLQSTTNSEIFGKILPLLHAKDFAHILNKSRTECISATIEKYYPLSIYEYKKVVDLLLIK
jgi:hypothetical protein